MWRQPQAHIDLETGKNFLTSGDFDRASFLSKSQSFLPQRQAETGNPRIAIRAPSDSTWSNSLAKELMLDRLRYRLLKLIGPTDPKELDG
jgi:hypothetical protein